MKKIILATLLCVFAVTNSFAQYLAEDTNGPMGECLFPQDNKWQEVVEVTKTKDEILEGAAGCMVNLPTLQDFKCKVNNANTTAGIYICDVQIYLGDVEYEIPFAGIRHKHFSEVKFKVKVEAKENKYRVTFYDFFTERMTIHGEAKSNGQSNTLHWQRVNSLTKERVQTSRKKKIEEYNELITREEKTYIDEWASVTKVMEALKHCTDEPDF